MSVLPRRQSVAIAMQFCTTGLHIPCPEYIQPSMAVLASQHSGQCMLVAGHTLDHSIEVCSADDLQKMCRGFTALRAMLCV